MSNNDIAVAGNKVLAETSVKYSLISRSLSLTRSVAFLLSRILFRFTPFGECFTSRQNPLPNLQNEVYRLKLKNRQKFEIRNPLLGEFCLLFVDKSVTAGIDCMKTD